MQKGNTNQALSKINELASSIASQLGLTVLNTDIKSQGKQKHIEICIYRQDNPISFADCESMTREFGQALESEEASGSDLVGGPFSIDVQSPGIDRKLTNLQEFKLFAGKPVRVIAKEKIGSIGTEFIAILNRGDESSIVLSNPHTVPDKVANKKGSIKNDMVLQNNSELILGHSQIYGIYLWPGSNPATNSGGF